MQTTPIYLVTGATRGIGRAVASALAARSLRVIAVGRSGEKLHSLRERFGAFLSTILADLSTDEGVHQVAASIGAQVDAGASAIAGIVHAAGSLVSLEPYGEVDVTTLEQHFRVHVAAPIRLTQEIGRNHSIERMLFIDSYSASNARVGWSAYSIVKAAAQMAARCAAQELSSTRTILVYPGAVKTQVVDAVLQSQTETAKAFAAIKERGELAEPSAVAKFLVALLVDAPDALLGAQDSFDYNSAEDRKNVERLRQ